VQFKLIARQKLTSDVNVLLDITVTPIQVDVSSRLCAHIHFNVALTNFGTLVEAPAEKSNVLEAQ